jgi:hypothetical protein
VSLPGWKPLLLATVAGAVAITVVGPNHTDLQLAGSADEFRALLDEPGRHLAAAAIDLVFAACYGLLGVVGLRIVGGSSLLARLGQAVIVAGAAFDEIENVFLLRNIEARDSLTDGWVDAMQVPGTLKWIATPGFLVLIGWLIVSKLRGHGPRPG